MSPAPKRALALAAVAGVVCACAASASALKGTSYIDDSTAGHNPATKTLEAGFKIAQLARKESADGCYPAPSRMAKLIKRDTGTTTTTTTSTKNVKRKNVIYVLTKGATCNNILMALLGKQGVYLLDAEEGSLAIVGREAQLDTKGGRGPLRGITTVTSSSTLTEEDQVKRLTVRCPGKTYPLGGGIRTDVPPGADGEGIYSHSYERLGAQRGWHINPVLLDPAPESTVARTVTLQSVCAKGLVPTSSPHTTVFVQPGQVKTAVARCPKGSVLVTGGFQRTNFRSQSGNFPTESRAISSTAWQVTGGAHGADGGELTSIAYCDKSKRPLLTEVSGSVAVPLKKSATATTGQCPAGQTMTANGFSFNGTHTAFFEGAWFNSDGTVSASGFGYFTPAATFTAYGYCLTPGR